MALRTTRTRRRIPSTREEGGEAHVKSMPSQPRYVLLNEDEEIDYKDIETRLANDSALEVEKEFSYIIDPHTAVAVGACLSDEGSPGKVPRVCMACAHPGKFSKAVSDALGGAPPVQWMPNREHPAVA